MKFVQPYVVGSNELIDVSTENSSEIHYFVINSEGEIILSGVEDILNDNASINLDGESGIVEGVNTITHQIQVCREKAGLKPEDPIEIFRFESKRYK